MHYFQPNAHMQFWRRRTHLSYAYELPTKWMSVFGKG